MESYEKIADTLEELLRRRRAGRKRKAPITLPALGAFEDPAENVKLARVRLRIQADPLQIETGAYADRPRYGVGEVTPERMGHIKRGKGWLATESERFKDGRPTGLQHKRIKSQLEMWFERGAIQRASWLAFQAFQRDHDLSIYAGGTEIAGYAPAIAKGERELLPAEMRAKYLGAKLAAIRAVDPVLHPVLAWVAECGQSDVSAQDLAMDFWPKHSEQVRLNRFQGVVDYLGSILSRHYDLAERHRWVEMATSRAAEEIAAKLGLAA